MPVYNPCFSEKLIMAAQFVLDNNSDEFDKL